MSAADPSFDLKKSVASVRSGVVASLRLFMKTLLTLVALAGLSSLALADIHDPPMNDQGPTRKLGRGIANILFGVTEIVQTPAEINEREGNAAGASYGVVRGFGRFFVRLGMGFYEVATFPFPTTKGSYRPPYRLDPPWIHGGLEEFPPELGWESRYGYARTGNHGY
jgi:putative exosortase-associated protein (TIGR04073 family)